MNEPETYFVVPTHRLRDVSDTIHEYDDHFWRNGHSPEMMVFDDSTPTNVEKYFGHLQQLKTRSELFYVGNRSFTLMYTLGGLRGGEFLVDTAMDLETNPHQGSYGRQRRAKMAQTFRSGTN